MHSESSAPRPILRWAGSKRRLARILSPHLRALGSNTYFEPFAGSASLFLALAPSKAVLGDINCELINAYRILRSDPVALWLAVRSIPKTSREYYALRAQTPDALRAFDRAARFIYLNRWSFNGVYRTDRAGRFNVPRGSRTGAIPEPEVFAAVSALLGKAELQSADFAHTVKAAGHGDLVYLDPPYHSPTRMARGEYGYDAFRVEDMSRLIKLARSLDGRGVKVLISYRSAAPLRQFLGGWYFRRVPVRRQVSGKTTARVSTSEILVSNWHLPPLRSNRAYA